MVSFFQRKNFFKLELLLSFSHSPLFCCVANFFLAVKSSTLISYDSLSVVVKIKYVSTSTVFDYAYAYPILLLQSAEIGLSSISTSLVHRHLQFELFSGYAICELALGYSSPPPPLSMLEHSRKERRRVQNAKKRSFSGSQGEGSNEQDASRTPVLNGGLYPYFLCSNDVVKPSRRAD